VTVDGVDLAASAVQRAQAATDGAGLGGAVRFHFGDAERVPLPDNTFDAVVTECAFCTFPDKAAAASELARLLRPGGRLGLADVTVAETGPPDELTTTAGWVACIADARPLGRYVSILASAGLSTIHSETYDGALMRMIDQV
jgi:arsenite methyltransferase